MVALQPGNHFSIGLPGWRLQLAAKFAAKLVKALLETEPLLENPQTDKRGCLSLVLLHNLGQGVVVICQHLSIIMYPMIER